MRNNLQRRYPAQEIYLWRVEGWPPCEFEK